MRSLAAVLMMLIAMVGCSPTTTTHGVPNLVQVEPGVWRGGQPSAEGWAYLASLGVKTSIKLNYESEGSDATATAYGISVATFSIPPAGDLIGTLEKPDPYVTSAAVDTIVAAKILGGVYVHCTHGQDRTGYLVARFRVEKEAWAKSRARKEMLSNHFHIELLGLDAAWEDVAERDGALP